MSVTARKKTMPVPPTAWADDAIRAAHERQQRDLPPALQEVAVAAAQTWGKVLFPTPKIEEWKYTNPEEIAQGPFASPPEAPPTVSRELVSQFDIPKLTAHRLVFVDGSFVESLSSVGVQQGVTVTSLRTSRNVAIGALGAHEREPFAALATALLNEGVVISLERGAAAAVPFHVVNVMTKAAEGCVTAPRLLVEAADNSRVTVVESSVALGAERYLALPVAEIRAAQGACVDYYKLQQESTSAFHISSTDIEQDRDSTVRTHVFSFGGQLVRNNVSVRLKGSGANAVLNGLSVLSASQHVDNSTIIHHIEPSSESREHFKGIYGDMSRGVFSGTITVDQIAQKTNAFQSNQALLLSPQASIETRPQLKIWADDVKCTHGATVGQLNAEAMYYLRSRGIDRETARNFLVHAFASEVLSSVELEPLRQHVEGVISLKLDGVRQEEIE